MFIPRGKTVQENLATSYVQLDALVADLCEGGFSGVVEVVLHDRDSFVIVNTGDVAAVVERRSDHAQARGKAAYNCTTVEQLAERSRLERGRLSIYRYSTATASAVAGRINAQPLYAGLTTEFTDLEKMILKLVGERDREWFIEINTEHGPRALIHLRDGRYRILDSTEDGLEEGADSMDVTGNTPLGKLLHECSRARATFDVYFSDGTEGAEAAQDVSGKSATPEAVSPDDVNLSRQPGRQASPDLAAADLEDKERSERPDKSQLAVLESPKPSLSAEVAPAMAASFSAGFAGGASEGEPFDVLSGSAQLSASPDAEAMAEIKRMMGEIARTIEEAAQAVDRPDSFSMSLRAGQLKIADRYPFLDPFMGEIEYLGGEIVFIGQATAEEFITGLTEALKLAVEAVLRSTNYTDRFRAYVIEDLQKLLAREREAFERFGLDRVIEQIIAF
jgi:hypothetical protein